MTNDKPKNRAAQALVNLRWKKKKAKPAEQAMLGQSLVNLRWAKASKAERKAHAEYMASFPRKQRKPHCPCGAMTRERARKRNHVCEKAA